MSAAQVRSGARVSRGSTLRIFISYRRADSAAIVGHIHERLVGRYRKDAIFRDIEDLPLGHNSMITSNRSCRAAMSFSWS